MRRVLLSLALSGIALGVLAWWFITPEKGQAIPPPKATEPQPQGIRMEKFSLRDSQRHQTRWEILADVAHVDAKAATTIIEGVHLTLFSERHGTVQVTAKHGLIDNHSKDMQVCGDVRLNVGQEFALTAECLKWHATEQALETATPVTVSMGTLRVQGQGFRGWIAEERFEIYEQVQAQWRAP